MFRDICLNTLSFGRPGYTSYADSLTAAPPLTSSGEKRNFDFSADTGRDALLKNQSGIGFFGDFIRTMPSLFLRAKRHPQTSPFHTPSIGLQLTDAKAFHFRPSLRASFAEVPYHMIVHLMLNISLPLC